MSTVYIVIVNWNGWYDTLECLESIYNSTYQDFTVIICDNCSTDRSIDFIKAWAEKRLSIIPSSNALRHLTVPPVSKPIPYQEYDEGDVGMKGGSEHPAPLVIIKATENRGFAGGNNLGLRYAGLQSDFTYAWLLNNDTVVSRDALSELVLRMALQPEIGMCGSTLCLYDQPSRIQAMGGAFYCSWLALPWHLGRLKRIGCDVDAPRIEKKMDYVIGASMLVSQRFVREIGLMSEEYFLFYEELDWAERSRGVFSLAYAPKSIVYHKVGKTIGTSSDPRKKSYLCDYYTIRNRILFTRKFFPLALPTVYLVSLGAFIIRVLLGKWDRALMVLSIIFGASVPPLCGKPDRQLQ